MNLTEVVERVKVDGEYGSPYRPDLTVVKCEEPVSRCIQDCWHDDPEMRPDFKYCRVRLKSMQKGLYVAIISHYVVGLEYNYCNCISTLREKDETF